MKVLWTVNTVLPDIAKEIGYKQGHAISWVDAMKTKLIESKENIELIIVCNGGNKLNELIKLQNEGIIYYVIPSYKKIKENWDTILEEVKPNLIHIYGTERRHNMYLIDKYKDSIPMIISLQGILSEYVKHYFAFIPFKDIVMNYTLKDIMTGGIIGGKVKFYIQSIYEKKMLRSVKFLEGRSDWDKAISSKINPYAKYYDCPRMIRKNFFGYKWNFEKCEKYTIFVHQGNYPIKGLHFMLEALAIVKLKFPNVTLYISGNNILESNSIFDDGYTRYIRTKIKKLELEQNIIFTGFLNADKLAEKLSEMHICAIPSAIENAPNALAEAMIVGTPCVASYVGGNAQMLDYGDAGLMYCYYEPQMLASRIIDMFEHKDKIIEISNRASDLAKYRHDPDCLVKKLLTIYTDVERLFEK